MNSNIYVTFQVKPRILTYLPTKYYAVKCENMEEARNVASDIYSYDGISYLRINKCGKIRKDATIMNANNIKF